MFKQQQIKSFKNLKYLMQLQTQLPNLGLRCFKLSIWVWQSVFIWEV